MKSKSLLTVLMIPLLAAAPAALTTEKQALLMALRTNSQQLSTLQWKQKVTGIRKGTAMVPIVEEIRFDATGQMRRTTLARPEPKRMGPLKARKAAEVKDTIEDVMQLARQYADPRTFARAVERGELWQGPHNLRIQARSVLLPGDDLSVAASGATYLATRADCKTQHEGDPIAIAIDYEQLPNGPSVMRRMFVQIPKDDIAVHVESFDFVRLAAPTIP